MYCVNCGAKIPEGAAFCESCGAPVQNRPVQTVGVPHQEKKPESGAEILVRLLVCTLGGFLLAVLMSAIPDLMWSEGGATAMPMAALMVLVHSILILTLAWKPFCRKLGAGFGAVAAFGVSLLVSLCLVALSFSIGQKPVFLIPATLLYGGVLYGVGLRFEKKD